jgi:Fe-S cluster assembly ATPase SufC
MDSNETREDKVEKPHAHFGDPQDVKADSALSKEEKVEALETLEQDARLLTTAVQEGMTGGEENKLQEVLDAKKALEERDGAPNPADNPPAGSDAEVAKEAEIEKLDP